MADAASKVIAAECKGVIPDVVLASGLAPAATSMAVTSATVELLPLAA